MLLMVLTICFGSEAIDNY